MPLPVLANNNAFQPWPLLRAAAALASVTRQVALLLDCGADDDPHLSAAQDTSPVSSANVDSEVNTTHRADDALSGGSAELPALKSSTTATATTTAATVKQNSSVLQPRLDGVQLHVHPLASAGAINNMPE
jgi:hypothetical protein